MYCYSTCSGCGDIATTVFDAKCVCVCVFACLRACVCVYA